MSFIKADGSKNGYIDIVSFKNRKKEYVSDIKCNTKTTAIARLYLQEIFQITFNKNKMIFFPPAYTISIHFKRNHRDSNMQKFNM